MSGGHSEIDKLINHFENGGTRDSFKRGGKVDKDTIASVNRVNTKTTKDERGKNTISTVIQVDTEDGKRYYEGESTSRDHAAAWKHSLENAQKKVNENPSDSLSTEDYKLKYEDLEKPKKAKGGKVEKYEEGGKPMTDAEEASDDAAYYQHLRKTNPEKYYELFPDAPGGPGDDVGPFGVKDGVFSKKKIRERKEKRRTRKHKRYERKMERKYGEDWDVHGEYDESGTWVPDKPKKAKGGKVKEKDFEAHVKEASSMDKSYSEYNRPKTSYEVAPKKRRRWKYSKKGSKY